MKKPNPFLTNPNIPIVGQPVADYAFGCVLILPHTVTDIAALTDSVAKTVARKAKGDIAIVRGTEFRTFSYEEFCALIWPKPADDAEPQAPLLVAP